MQTVYIMRGPSGSGKSTMAQQIMSQHMGRGHVHVVSADAYMYEGGVYCFQRDKLSMAHKMCFAEFCYAVGKITFAQDDGVVIVDNTNIRRWEFAPYVTVAQKLGWNVEYCIPPKPWSAATFAVRNIHGVPLETVARMISEFEE